MRSGMRYYQCSMDINEVTLHPEENMGTRWYSKYMAKFKVWYWITTDNYGLPYVQYLFNKIPIIPSQKDPRELHFETDSIIWSQRRK